MVVEIQCPNFVIKRFNNLQCANTLKKYSYGYEKTNCY